MAFNLSANHFIFKSKAESIDSIDNVLCYGTNNGYVSLGNIKITDNLFEIEETNTMGISKKKINKVIIQKATKHVIALSNGQLYILDPISLDINKIILKDTKEFAVNKSAWIAAITHKKIILHIIKIANNTIEPLLFNNKNEYEIKDQPLKLSIVFLLL